MKVIAKERWKGKKTRKEWEYFKKSPKTKDNDEEKKKLFEKKKSKEIIKFKPIFRGNSIYFF